MALRRCTRGSCQTLEVLLVQRHHLPFLPSQNSEVSAMRKKCFDLWRKIRTICRDRAVATRSPLCILHCRESLCTHSLRPERILPERKSSLLSRFAGRGLSPQNDIHLRERSLAELRFPDLTGKEMQCLCRWCP